MSDVVDLTVSLEIPCFSVEDNQGDHSLWKEKWNYSQSKILVKKTNLVPSWP